MGALLLSRHPLSGVSGARQLRGCAVASVVALQAQDQTNKGRQLSTAAPLRDLRARASDPAWARRAVGEGVRSCPRAGCREIRMSGCVSSEGLHVQQEQNCRGRSQSPVVWIAEEMETEPSKPIDKTSRGEVTSHRAVTTVNALWPRK